MTQLKKVLCAYPLAVFLLAGCATNPVTGERNFQIYGTDWERQVGAQMYAPMKQSQGGEFKLDPELTTYVQEVGGRLAERSRRQGELDYEFQVVNNSVPNAWALPGGKIVIYRGLLTELGSEAELAAVLGHEIVHADASHGARAQSKGMLTQIGAVVSMVILDSQVENQAAREVAMMVPALGAQMLTQKYSRDAERESDRYGMQYMSEAGYDPQGAVDLQKTFVKLSEGRNPDWMSGLFASHPASPERVENNRETASKLPPGGIVGREKYQQKIAYLKRIQPAYDAFGEAQKAMSEEDLAQAREKLNRAIRIEPREARFHQLLGDSYALEKRLDKALKAYRESIQLEPGFFYGHLRKGQVNYLQDKHSESRQSLERSLELLETAEAHYLLGMIDKKAGHREAAIERLGKAAQSGSETGYKARDELVRLDIGANPSNYVASRPAVDSKGRVFVQFQNQTRLPLRDIEVSYRWRDGQGQLREGRKRYAGPLGAGKRWQVELGFRIENPAELHDRVRLAITGAGIDE